MLYWKVKKEHDNRCLCVVKRGRYVNNGEILVGEELYTLKEWEKLVKTHVFGCAPEKCVELVEVKKTNTYWFFGARFEIGHASREV